MQFITSMLVVVAYLAIGYIIGVICSNGNRENITMGGVLCWPLIVGGYLIYVVASVFIVIVKWIRDLWKK